MEKGEGDDFYPQERHYGYRMMMSAMGQMPVLGQFPKGVVFYLPAQVSDVTNDGAVVAVQVPRHHPNPILFFLLLLPFLAHALALGPLLSHSDHSNWPRIGVGEANARHIPNLNSPPVPLHYLRWLLPVRQRQRLLVSFIAFLFEHRHDRPAQLLNHRFEKRSIGIPGVHHRHVEEPWPVLLAHPAQQAQGGGAFLFTRAHGFHIQNHAQLRATQLRIDLLVIALSFFELLALGIFAGDLSSQAILARAMIAAKLLIGVQASNQQTGRFIGFKGLAAFEFVPIQTATRRNCSGSNRSLT